MGRRGSFEEVGTVEFGHYATDAAVTRSGSRSGRDNGNMATMATERWRKRMAGNIKQRTVEAVRTAQCRDE